MEKKIREVCDTLRALGIELRCYCHSEECNKITQCPSYHEDCRKKLDLDTSIAWELFREVDLVLWWIKRDRRMTYLCLERTLPIVGAFAGVVERHQESYSRLLGLVYRTFNTLVELQRLLEAGHD